MKALIAHTAGKPINEHVQSAFQNMWLSGTKKANAQRQATVLKGKMNTCDQTLF